MSMNLSTAGLRVLRHIIGMTPKQAGDVLTKATPYLTYMEDAAALDFIRTHLTKHGVLPTAETVMDGANVFLPEPTEPLSYDMEQLKGRYLTDGMREASDEATLLLQQGDPAGALNAMLGRLLPLTKDQATNSIADLREVAQNVVDQYAAQLAGTAPMSKTLGYKTLDAQGGLEGGDMIGIVGRPGSGKTWMMLSSALRCWSDWNEPVLFCTQEMSGLQITKRALPIIIGTEPGPLYSGKPIQYQINGLTPDQYLQTLNDFSKMLSEADVPFYIYDSKMAGSVADIEAIASVHGIKNIWIDGAYMLRHPNRSLNRYARVAENLDLLKYFCQSSGAICTTSWQFQRGAGKNDAIGEAPDLDSIGYSHAIGEYMTVIMGLLENPKSLTQMTKKKVSVMKGRNGEVGSFDINWNFNTCDFTEVAQEEVTSDLTYI